MNRFEDELRAALGRRDPPAGFAERVMARIDPPPQRLSRARWWAVAAVAASLLVGIALPSYREHRRGQEAKEQVLLALHITAEKMAVAQTKVEQLSRREIGHE